MKVNPVAWFEIPAENLDRAKTFYESVFGYILTLNEMGPLKMAFFPMTNEVYGAAGALVKADCFRPSQEGALIYFSVTDIDATLAKVTAGGGKIIKPKTAIGQYGFIGHFVDSEGNGIGLHTM